ncbi:beta-lactamase family protein [Vibrio tubiashii]|uniref:serine hydrolase domain-containing protein n=1 Tax=Vibrio tubiashii TaxID=29498 RepID=UPI001EFDED98|nr:serine hydrolase domain-containing protein [Vibrio tubiashii]MCG9581716.1 beta-lactamase family protein [Vibrio tubiashii]MCG9615307.1 beta-lactamase family protein [Vibrio tubiashii]MCG9689272.1 beta-lactamase family protein [Vibrio tubiashii]
MRGFLLSIVLFSSSVLAQQPEAFSNLVASYKYASNPELRYSLDERMAFWQIPSVSVSTFKEGQKEWQFSHGLTHESGQLVNTDTRYQVASMSKPVTTLITLRAIEKGLLTLDEYIQPLLAPEFEKVVTSPVTLRQLLSHKAGFNHTGYMGVESDQALPKLNIFTRSDSKLGVLKQEFVVGDYHYSNGGYILVQHILEQVYDKPFEVIADQEVFEPLKMVSSSFVQPTENQENTKFAHAHRYGEWVAKGWHKYAAKSAAGLWTTPTDLTRMLLAVHQAYIGDDESWLSQESVQQIDYPGTSFMGLGFFRNHSSKEGYVFHGGINHGFEGHFVLYPKLGTGAVVLTNGQRGDQLAQEILRAVSLTEGWIDFPLYQTEVLKVDLEELKPLIGRYQYSEDFYADVFIRNGLLYIQGYQQDAYALHKVAENHFKPLEFESTFYFKFSKTGKLTGLTQEAPFYNGFAKKVK